jgi:hypothetical protein
MVALAGVTTSAGVPAKAERIDQCIRAAKSVMGGAHGLPRGSIRSVRFLRIAAPAHLLLS